MSKALSALAALLGLAALVVALAALNRDTTRTVTVTASAVGTSTSPSASPSASPSTAPSSDQSAPQAGSITSIYNKEAKGVVQVVSTTSSGGDPALGIPPQSAQALGSGFVIDNQGHIVTNYHVIQGASKVEVSFSDSDSYTAKVLGSDPSTDLALLQVSAPSSLLDPLPLGDSDQVVVGQPVVAIGNPLGLDRTATSGIVSALQRQIQAPNNFAIDHVIQTDAAITHGNSGGPLLDLSGQVIGVNAQIATDPQLANGGADTTGFGFAIPVNTVKQIVAELEKSGQVSHAYLGVSLRPLDEPLAQALKLPVKQGMLVESVRPGTGAAKAGLKGPSGQVTVGGQQLAKGGDVIVSIDGHPTPDFASLHDVIANKHPGDKVTLVVYRGQDKLQLTVTLGTQPASAAQG
jgi:S1-C subfamily serine protease